MSSDVEIVTTNVFSSSVAEAIAAALRSLGQGETISLALSGGATPRRVYAALSELPGIRWDRVELFQTDERAVSSDAPRSNYWLILSTLMAGLSEDAPAIHRMEADQADLSSAVRRYEESLPPKIDIAALGIGGDGHVASIFPGDSSIWCESRRVVTSVSPIGESRMTLTPQYLGSAENVIVFASGAQKAEAVRRALDPDADQVEVPAALFRDAHWILDPDAGKGLDRD